MDLWERISLIVCQADLAKKAGIDVREFVVELRKRYPTEDKLRAMWDRTTESLPYMRHMLDDVPMTCPHCGRFNEAYSGVNTPLKPKPGDATLCFGCGEWAIFEAGGARKPNADELAEIEVDPVCVKVRGAWLQTVEDRGRPPHVSRH